jgi:hypothetical protein
VDDIRDRVWNFATTGLPGLWRSCVYGGMVGTGYLPFSIDLVFGVPSFLLSQLLATILFLGLTSFRTESDVDQEWLGRAGGLLLFAALLWIGVTFVILANRLLTSILVDQFSSWLLSVGGISGAITWIIGRSGLAPPTGEAKDKLELAAKVALAIVAPIFAIAILIACAALVDHIVLPKSVSSNPDNPVGPWLSHWLPFILSVVVGACVAAFASVNININRVSLHSLYRNRLVRAFLGASNPNRQPNLFTDFDPSDNLPMSSLFEKRGFNFPAHGNSRVSEGVENLLR